MIALVAALLCQGTLLWSTVPNADKKVTLKMPLATLTEVTAAIYKQVDLRIQVTKVPEQKLTVLVRDMKASDLLEEIADVLELKLYTADARVWVSLPQQPRQDRAAYLNLEDKLIQREATERIDALVAAIPSVADDLTGESSDDLKGWARQKVRTPAGYAAAMARRAFLTSRIQWEHVQPLPISTLWAPFETYGYAFLAPPNLQVAAYGHRSLDAFSQRFEGAQFLIRYRPVTGTWAIKGITRDSAGTIDDDPKLLKYPKPPKALAQHPYAVNLAEWTKGDPDSKLGDEKVSREEDGGDQLFTQGPMLADHLAWLHANSKVNFVATAYRVPSGLKQIPLQGHTLKECLANLNEKSDCFISVSKRCVRVRQGGYWRLDACEPPEGPLRVIEAAARERDLTIDDYGRYAATLYFPWYERFEGPNRLLTNFDLRPLERGLEFLQVYGQQSAANLKVLWNGATLSNGVNGDLNRAAVHGAMGDAGVVGRFAELLEYPTGGDLYLGDKGMNDKYWDGLRASTVASGLKLIFPNGSTTGNVGIFLTPNGRDGVLFWFKG